MAADPSQVIPPPPPPAPLVPPLSGAPGTPSVLKPRATGIVPGSSFDSQMAGLQGQLQDIGGRIDSANTAHDAEVKPLNDERTAGADQYKADAA